MAYPYPCGCPGYQFPDIPVKGVLPFLRRLCSSILNLPDDIFIRPEFVCLFMSGKSGKAVDPKDPSPYGGLENLTDEQIEKNIRDYPYVMGKLKE